MFFFSSASRKLIIFAYMCSECDERKLENSSVDAMYIFKNFSSSLDISLMQLFELNINCCFLFSVIFT